MMLVRRRNSRVLWSWIMMLVMQTCYQIQCRQDIALAAATAAARSVEQPVERSRML
jgi:hypothetical protein